MFISEVVQNIVLNISSPTHACLYIQCNTVANVTNAIHHITDCKFCIFQVKGHKGVYQFLSIPYEAEGFDHQGFNTCSETYGTPPMVASPEDSSTDSSEVTLDCTERLAGDGEMTPIDNCGTAVDCRDSTEDNSETTVETRVKVENGFDQPCRSRAQSWSEYSMSSDSSSKSLEELQADLLTMDVLDHFSENMDFVFKDDNNVEMCENGELFDLL